MEILNHYVALAEDIKLGGVGSRVEIDESIFSHLTFRTSKKKYGHWELLI